jgi:hypothetical protein
MGNRAGESVAWLKGAPQQLAEYLEHLSFLSSEPWDPHRVMYD